VVNYLKYVGNKYKSSTIAEIVKKKIYEQSST